MRIADGKVTRPAAASIWLQVSGVAVTSRMGWLAPKPDISVGRGHTKRRRSRRFLKTLSYLIRVPAVCTLEKMFEALGAFWSRSRSRIVVATVPGDWPPVGLARRGRQGGAGFPATQRADEPRGHRRHRPTAAGRPDHHGPPRAVSPQIAASRMRLAPRLPTWLAPNTVAVKQQFRHGRCAHRPPP